MAPESSSRPPAAGRLRALTLEELVRSSGWLDLLSESVATPLFVHDGVRLLWVNEAIEKLTGFSSEELLQMSPFDLIDPDQRRELTERWQERLGGLDLGVKRYEARVRTKGGGLLWVELAMQPIFLDGRPAGFGTAWDITARKETEAALRKSEERLELAQSAGEIVLWEWEASSDRVFLPSQSMAFAGLRLEEIRDRKSFLQTVHPQDLPRLRAAFDAALAGDRDFFVEHRVVLPPSQTRWLAHRGKVYFDERGQPLRMLGVALDVTHRKLAEEALIQEKERAQVTLASIGDGVIRTDSRGMIDFMNPAAERLTGWPLREAYGRHVRDVVSIVDPETRAPLLDPVGRCLSEGRAVEYPGDRLLQPRTGHPIAVRDSASPILDRLGRTTGAVLALKDVSEIRQMEREREFLSTHDPLTHLLNRHAFESRVAEAVQTHRTRRLDQAVVLLDLDQFKLVNDSCGHFAGDALLKQVASTLRGVLPPGTPLARLGEDEFAALLLNLGNTDLYRIGEKIHQVFAPLSFQWQDRRFEVTASIGLARVDDETRDSGEILAAVDAACFVAKRKGGNRVHLFRAGDDAVAQRLGELSWMEEIQRALDERRFQLFAQRIVPLHVSTPSELLAEIFLRMRTSNGQYASTAAFIAAAERYRRISILDRWVVRKSLDVLSQRRSTAVGADAFTINLSGQSLGEDGFLEYVLDALGRSQVDPKRLCFEVTETAAISNLQAALRFLSSVRRVGCRVVLDDFGSGLSSFAYLRNLPVDLLKIDASFLHNLAGDPIQRALVESIEQLGRVLGLATIAEGVEDLATLDILRSIGVDYAQGYALHEPAPID